MKKLILTLFVTLLAQSAVADMSAVQTLSPQEKASAGFTIEYKNQKSLDGYVSPAFEVEMEYGRSLGQFALVLRAIILSDLDGQPQMKLATDKVVLSEELSQLAYAELSVDYTAKKIAEGVELKDAVVQCESAVRCLLIDEKGHNFLISNFGGSFKNHPGKFSSEQYDHVNNPYKPIPHIGAILDDSGQMTSDFLASVVEESFARAPDYMLYENQASTSPDHDKSYEEHRLEADKLQLEDLGKHPLERKLVQAMIFDAETTYKELVRKPSGGSCTYFCGKSGPFIRSNMKAEVKF